MGKYQTKKRQSLKVRQSKFNKIKNSLKRKKTHKKSIKQHGGVNPGIITIHNNGTGGEQNMGQQCIWISIRDYLRYHRGETNHTIRTLKASVNLDPHTDRMEFDNNNPLLQNALEQLCKKLCIRGVIIFIDHNGTINDFSFNRQIGQIVQTLVYNQDGICNQGGVAEDVYIASFGSHFELITEIPGGNYVLQPAPVAAPAAAPAASKPKVVIHNVYVNIDELLTDSDKKIGELRIKLVEETQNINFFENELDKNNKEIKQLSLSIKTLYAPNNFNNNLNNNKTELEKAYSETIKKINKKNDKTKIKILELKNQQKIIEYEIKLAENQEDIENINSEIEIIEIKILGMKADIGEISSFITSMSISNEDTKKQMTSMYSSEIKNLETEIKKAESEKALYSYRLKQFEEYKEQLKKILKET
jgi:hypothetical protein